MIVEDGTGLPDANSYASIATAETYSTLSGAGIDAALAWSALGDAAKEQHLIIATDYIDRRFGGEWKGGELKEGVQALAFPRRISVGWWDDCNNRVIDGLPAGLVRATVCMALESMDKGGALDDLPDSSGVISERVTNSIQIQYQDGSSRMSATKMVALQHLSGLLIKPQNGIMRRIIRA